MGYHVFDRPSSYVFLDSWPVFAKLADPFEELRMFFGRPLALKVAFGFVLSDILFATLLADCILYLEPTRFFFLAKLCCFELVDHKQRMLCQSLSSNLLVTDHSGRSIWR